VSKSQRLLLSDVRAMFRLIGECRELGDDARAWRPHLARGLCRLAESQLAICGEARVVESTGLMVPIDFADHGWPNPTGRGMFLAALKEPEVLDSDVMRRFNQLKGRRVTRTRQQVVEDRVYYPSAFHNEANRPSGLDHGMYSRCTPPGRDWQHQVILNRALGDRPFGRRECVLVHLLQGEIAPLFGRALATSVAPTLPLLAPRLRQTLDALLEGDSEKQTALRLGLSVHTVHEYVTSLYRRFNVSSRAELLAHFVRRRRWNGAAR
jgi:DNA-binding CsgD family transcriptional regulator